MLRVTTLKGAGTSAAQLIDYYAGLAEDQQRRDGRSRGPVDYYLDPDEPPGRWWGQGCEAVDLAGEVEADQLRHMLDARHPTTGGKLGRGFGAKSARGFDATFSATKSVSVLWALAPDPWVRAEVLAAHDTAVVAALDWVARHGDVTRRGTDGIDQVNTRGLVAALFRQHTSRSVDPQLHTHALIWSKVQDLTGKWLALDARWLKYQQRSIGWVYDAALRTELTARLGVEWEPVVEGRSDMVAIPEALRELFSQRSEQVEAKLAEYLARWSNEHDGADPDPRTIARLERWAVTDSRPAKRQGQEADGLRSDWAQRARAVGFAARSLPAGSRRLPGLAPAWDTEDVIAEALARVAAESSTWLRADLAREIATLLPPDAAASASELVALVDELAEEAAGRCLELHPPPAAGVALRADGRPVREHVVDRRLTTGPVLAQERRLLDWARLAVIDPGRGSGAIDAADSDDAQAAAARAVAGTAGLVLVVGPAGTGKTTTLAAAVASLRDQGRTVVGLAPSGNAADVLAREAGCPTMTLAKLLAHQDRPDHLPPPDTTVILDEAGMASTEDLDRLVQLAIRRHWRLACVGDPYQLPAVGRAGMFADWCDTLPAVRLEEVRRFSEGWEAAASLWLRAGDARAVDVYAAHGRLQSVHSALVAERVARHHRALTARGDSVAITTASAATARDFNRAIQNHQRNWRNGAGVRLRDGTKAWPGDCVATRRNHSGLVATGGTSVRNRQTWTVTAVRPDGSLTVSHPERGEVVMPADYVARQVELGWAVTGYGNQGVTTDHGICVVERTTSRAGLYVGMTRGRQTNVAWVVDDTGREDPAETLAAIVRRPANALTAHAVRDRLHGDAVPDVLDSTQRALARLDRLHGRPPPARSLGL